MKKLYSCFLSFLIFAIFHLTILNAQEQIVHIPNDKNSENEFYLEIVSNKKFKNRGDILVKSKITNQVVYEMKDMYQNPEEYSRVTSIDLDNDGYKEDICYGWTGGNGAYVNILIFDFRKSIKPLYDIWTISNIENLSDNQFFYKNTNYTNIIVRSETGYGALQRSFYFPLKYSKGELEIDFETDNENFLSLCEKNTTNLLQYIKNELKIDCNKESTMFPFEAIYLQSKFVGNIEYGENIINKYFKCKNKSKLMSSMDDAYKKITDIESYKYISR